MRDRNAIALPETSVLHASKCLGNNSLGIIDAWNRLIDLLIRKQRFIRKPRIKLKFSGQIVNEASNLGGLKSASAIHRIDGQKVGLIVWKQQFHITLADVMATEPGWC